MWASGSYARVRRFARTLLFRTFISRRSVFMSAKRHERTFARRRTVQVLYTSEIQNERPSVLLDTGRCIDEDGPLSEYALMLIDGVEMHRDVIDDYLESASENWALSRMPIVDRTILRLATFEMVYVNDVPISVSINEAVELAKDFGGEDDSPRFVNGVLGRIAKKLEADEAEAVEAAEGAEAAEAAQGDVPDVQGAAAEAEAEVAEAHAEAEQPAAELPAAEPSAAAEPVAAEPPAAARSLEVDAQGASDVAEA